MGGVENGGLRARCALTRTPMPPKTCRSTALWELDEGMSTPLVDALPDSPRGQLWLEHTSEGLRLPSGGADVLRSRMRLLILQGSAFALFLVTGNYHPLARRSCEHGAMWYHRGSRHGSRQLP